MDKIRGFTCHANIIHNRWERTAFCKISGKLFDKIKERKIFLVNSAITKDKSY